MAGRNETTIAGSIRSGVQAVQNPTTSSSQQGSTNFSGIEDKEALQALQQVLQDMVSGGTPEQKQQRAERQAQIASARQAAGDYSKGAAFSDASALMAQMLRQAMEKNMPAISRAVQGAGTSASSMQGLLSQKLAAESSQAASALGAEQAKAYGAIQAQLQGVLEGLTRVDNSGAENIFKALDLFKVQKGNSWGTSSTSGGGTTLVPITETIQKLSDTDSNRFQQAAGSSGGLLDFLRHSAAVTGASINPNGRNIPADSSGSLTSQSFNTSYGYGNTYSSDEDLYSDYQP